MEQSFPPIDWQRRIEADIDRMRVERLYELRPGALQDKSLSEILARHIPVWPQLPGWPSPFMTEEKRIGIEQETQIKELREQLAKAKAENEKLIEQIEDVTARFQRSLK